MKRQEDLRLPIPSRGALWMLWIVLAALVFLPAFSWPLSPSPWTPTTTASYRTGVVNPTGCRCFGPDSFLNGKNSPVLRCEKAFSSWGGRIRCQMRPSGDDDDDEQGRIHFDDFGDHVIGGDDQQFDGGSDASVGRRRSAPQESLSSQLQAVVEQQESRRLDNWRKGNWQVRGLSLDPDSAAAVDDHDAREDESSAPRIRVCMVAADPCARSRVWVGRTDGSLLAVQLGDDFLTTFRSQLSATYDGATGAAQIATRLVNDKNPKSSAAATGDNDDDESVRSEAWSGESPFELQCQATVGSSPVSCVLVCDDEVLFSACRNSGDIIQWRITEVEDDLLQLDRTATLTSAHGTDRTIIMLKTARVDGVRVVLISVAQDGSVGLWDTESGALLNRFQIDADDPNQQAVYAQSADCDGTNIFVGTIQGQVLAYSIRDVLSGGRDTTVASPSGQWTASVDHAVTAIACGGPGALGAGRTASYPSAALFTGDDTGAVKQWEVLSRSIGADGDRAATTKLESWPKLATQRLQKRAHVFQSMHTEAVTALLPLDSSKVLSASKDGSVVAWNPATGKSYFFMDGFEKDIRSLCVQENTLVTDGMKHLVCVHDFNVGEEVDDDDDWDRFEADR